MSVEVTTSRWRAVAWNRVAVFYGIALGGAAVVTALLVAMSRALPPEGLPLVQLATGALYMPMPLVAGLIVERRYRRRYLIAELRHGFWRAYGRSVLYGTGVTLVIVALGFLVAWAAGAVGLPGAGHLITGEAEFQQRMREINPGLTAEVPLPSVAQLAAGVVAFLVAGATVNALAAFGEEYGWRGVLTEELRPLGLVRATVVIGVLWGLWHAPIIIFMGHNYGSQWALGVPMMVAWTVPFSFLLAWVRAKARSILAPAVLHGSFNAGVGVFAMVIIGGNLFIALPMGWLLVLVLTVLAIIAWRFPPASESVRTL